MSAHSHGGRGSAAPQLPDVPRSPVQLRDRTIAPRPDGEAVPLAPVQHGMWVADRLLEGDTVYSVPDVLRLLGPLDREALRRTIDHLVGRHEVLRTTCEDGVPPRQVVHPPQPGRLVVVDLPARPEWSDARRHEEALRLVRVQAAIPFDLRNEPPFRAFLVGVRAEEHLLLFNTHHLATDEWSGEVLAGELAALYGAFVAGAVPDLEPLPIQYGDYARWQADRLTGPLLDDQLRYWREALDRVETELALPTDRPRPRQPSRRSARVRAAVPPHVAAGARELAARHGVTVFTTLLAATTAVLYRQTGQRRFAVGSLLAGRNATETESLIGLFSNTVAVPADLTGDPSFGELLRRTNLAVLDAMDHQDVPFDLVVRESGVTRDASRNPLFQVLFQSVEAGAQEFAGLTVERVELADTPLPLDLVIRAVRSDVSLHLEIDYATDLFDAHTPERLIDQVIAALDQMSADASRPVRTLELPVGEHELVTRRWSSGAPTTPVAATVHGLFEGRVAAHPNATAVTEPGGGATTYRELDRSADSLARRLYHHGVRRGTVVGVFLDRGLALPAAVLAVLKAGGVYLPLDPAYPHERLGHMLADTAAPVLLTSARLRLSLPPYTGAVVLVDGEPDVGESAEPPPDLAGRTVGQDDLAYVIYTSGSSGRPKGVALRHGGAVNLAVAQQSAFDLGPGRRVLQFASICFDASVWEMLMALASGSTLCLDGRLDGYSAERLAAVLAEQAVDVITLPPSVLDTLRRSALTPGMTVVAAGERCPVDLAADLSRSSRFHNAYGPTEVSVCATIQPGPVGADQSAVPIGRPIDGAEVYVLDADLRPVPIGVAGELCVGGAGLAQGYLGQPGLTAERFVPSPYSDAPGARLYRTGDRCRWRADGLLEFLGRDDDQVKIRGHRIELGEIEATLRRHPDVHEAVVVPYDVASATRLIAYVAGDAQVPPADLRAWLANTLPDWMVPGRYVTLPALPLSPTGKVDRAALPSPDVAPPDLGSAYEPARNPTEQALVGLWQQVLEVPRVGVWDNFFELGGDSLLAIQMVDLARAAGLRLRVQEILAHQTVAALAPVVARDETVERPRPARDQETGVVPLTPIQHFFTELDYPHDYFNQSVVLCWERSPDQRLLSIALHALVTHHAALRLRLTRDGAGWQQRVATEEAADLLRTVDLPPRDAERQRAAMTEIADQAHSSLDLSVGPLLRAVLFREPGAADTLLLTVHHVAVDAVSWSILLQDLATAYRQLEAGTSVRLPATTTSFADWSQRLAAYADSAEFAPAAAGWPAHRPAPVPVDLVTGPNDEASVRSVTRELPAAMTAMLLRDVPAAFSARIGDVLLTALARTLSAWSGSAACVVHLEGHGRDQLFDDVDLSRTVGWFTALYPVRLELPEGDLVDQLRAVREQCGAVPSPQAGYGIARYLREGTAVAWAARPVPQVGFNYLGRSVGDDAATDPLWRRAPGPLGHELPGSGNRPHLLDITAAVVGGRLTVDWAYSHNRHREETIRSLADRFLAELEGLVAEHDRGRTAMTASDFPLAGLTQAQLDGLTSTLDPRQVEDIYPLSALQAGMLAQSLHESGSGAYVEQLAYSIEGEFDQTAFAEAVSHVVNRHPALRTGLVWKGLPRPVQVVYRPGPVEILTADWSDLPAAGLPWRTERLLHEGLSSGFDLESAAVPQRFELVRTGEHSHLFVWHQHHVLLDGWSGDLALEELLSTYTALREHGRRPELAEPVPYRRYVEWLSGQGGADVAVYWRRVLEGRTAPTAIPVVANAPVTDPRVAVVRATVSTEDTDRLRAFARRHRITVNSVVHAAWGLLLSRYSGESDVLFGTTLSGRSAGVVGIERMLGMLINTVPVRIEVVGSELVPEWLGSVHRQLVESREHEFAALLDIQRYSAVPAGQQMFHSIVVFQRKAAAGPDRWPAGLTTTPLHTQERTEYPLVLSVTQTDGLDLELLYKPGLVDGDNADRMLSHYRDLLEQLVAGDGARLDGLAALPRSEARLVLEDWNGRVTSPSAPPLVLDLFAEWVGQNPTSPAVMAVDGPTIGYAELDRLANRFANLLVANGVGAETAVATLLPRSAHTVVLALAVMKAGGVYVPLDIHHPAAWRQSALRDAGVAVIVTNGEFEELVSGTGLRVVDVGDPRLDQQDDSPPPVRPDPDQLMHVMFTSGSTGAPKGIGLTQRNVARFATDPFWCSAPGERVLFHSSPAWDAATYEIWLPLTAGGCVVVAPEDRPDLSNFARLIRERAIGNTFITAGLLAALAEHDAACLAGMRRIASGGDVVSPASVQRVLQACPDTEVVNGYGPTETTVYATHRAVRAPYTAESTVPIGRPRDNTRVYVLDPQMRPVPAGVVGEAYIGGSGLARGYVGAPAATADRFVPDPFGPVGTRMYRTGDLMRWNPDGQLDFVGRVDDQVKVRGFRIELGAIESTLTRCPGVAQAAVVAHGPAGGHKRLIAYLVPGVGVDLDVDQVRRAAAVLPDYMVPTGWMVLDRIPLTSNHKVDRKALPQPAPGRTETHVPPSTPTELTLAAIWSAVLGVGQVGATDDFFALGGDSILSIQVAAQARAAGVAVSSGQVFQHRTLAQLAESVELAESTAPSHVEQATVTGKVALTPVLRWFTEQTADIDHYTMPVALVAARPVDPSLLREALDALVGHHDMLRFRLSFVDGTWSGHIEAAAEPTPVEVIDLSDTHPDRQDAEREGRARAAQGGLRLDTGRLLRAQVFRYGGDRPDEVLLTAHHAVLDVVSWNILLGDLETAYGQLLAGQMVGLPAKTTSFRHWAHRLAEHAAGVGFAPEAEYWAGERVPEVGLLVDHAGGTNAEGTAELVCERLSTEDTEALIRRVPAAYRTEINDILLTALAHTLTEWTGGSSAFVETETHGREPLFADVDLSRTVGWFTSLVPLVLDLPSGDWGARLSAVRAQLRAVPHHGIGFGLARYCRPDSVGTLSGRPRPGISFNYRGQLDRQRPAGTCMFEPLAWSPDGARDADRPRSHLLGVDASVTGGRLHLHWTYSTTVHSHDTVHGLARAYAANLLGLVEHCLAQRATNSGGLLSGGLSPNSPAIRLAMARHHVPGVSVALIRDGEPYQAWGQGVLRAGQPDGEEVTGATAFAAGSVSKHVSTLVALRLVQDGVLGLDDDVSEYLADLPVIGPGDPPLRLRHLLSHSSGLAHARYVPYAQGEPLPTLEDILAGRPPARSGPPVRRLRPPDTGYEYSNINFVLLEVVLTRATGLAFPELVRSVVLDPLGMSDTGYDQDFPAAASSVAAGHDERGEPFAGLPAFPELASGGMWSTPSDLTRVALEVQRAASGQGGILLSRDLAAKMLTPSRLFDGYGLGTFVRGAGRYRWFGHAGDLPGYRCLSVTYVDRPDGLVVMTNGAGGMRLINDVLTVMGDG